MQQVNTQASYSIAKALHMTKLSQEYFEDVIRSEEMTGNAKHFILELIKRQKWVEQQIYARMSPQGADALRAEMKRDIQVIDSIMNLAIAMDEDSRMEYEKIGEELSKKSVKAA